MIFFLWQFITCQALKSRPKINVWKENLINDRKIKSCWIDLIWNLLLDFTWLIFCSFWCKIILTVDFHVTWKEGLSPLGFLLLSKFLFLVMYILKDDFYLMKDRAEYFNSCQQSFIQNLMRKYFINHKMLKNSPWSPFGANGTMLRSVSLFQSFFFILTNFTNHRK